MSVLLSSRNIYLSTQPAGALGPDDQINKFRACLNNVPLQTGLNQYGKISLVDFHMYRNFYNVNPTNNTFFMRIEGLFPGAPALRTCTIVPGDYRLGNELSTAVGEAVLTQIQTVNAGATLTAAATRPTTDGREAQNGDGKLAFKIALDGNHGFTAVKFQCRNYNSGNQTGRLEDYNDSYALLGARRITARNDDFTETSLISNLSADPVTLLEVSGYYQMQDNTIPFVYLRCTEVIENLESESYRLGDGTVAGTHITGSSTLAKIKVGIGEVEFLGDNSSPYSLMTDNRNISQLFFQIVDQHGRNLPAIDLFQATLGNLHLEMTLNFSVYSRGVGQEQNFNIENNALNNAMLTQGIS